MIKISGKNEIVLKNKKEQGFAILELLFYIAFLAVLSLLVINAMMTMSRSFKETSIQGELTQSGTIMERISREIRQANDINLIDAHSLILNTGVNETIEFKFVNPDIELWENNGSNVFIGNLNSPNIEITSLTFTPITTAKSKSIKVALSLHSNNDSLARNQDFYNTIVLRGSY